MQETTPSCMELRITEQLGSTGFGQCPVPECQQCLALSACFSCRQWKRLGWTCWINPSSREIRKHLLMQEPGILLQSLGPALGKCCPLHLRVALLPKVLGQSWPALSSLLLTALSRRWDMGWRISDHCFPPAGQVPLEAEWPRGAEDSLLSAGPKPGAGSEAA